MNSFQKQFNTVLGLALGAQKLGGKTLGIPSAPVVSKEGTSEQEYQPLKMGYGSQFLQTGATTDEGRAALLAKERSLQNLRNRHEALRMIKEARKGELTFGGKK